MHHNRTKRIQERAAVLLLLFAVAGLSIAAKQGKYLPQSNPFHHFSKMAKMELVYHPVHFVAAPFSSVAKFVPPRPEASATPLKPSENLALMQVCLAVSFQHRAPPSYLA
jgi:hypothetical protein